MSASRFYLILPPVIPYEKRRSGAVWDTEQTNEERESAAETHQKVRRSAVATQSLVSKERPLQ